MPLRAVPRAAFPQRLVGRRLRSCRGGRVSEALQHPGQLVPGLEVAGPQLHGSLQGRPGPRQVVPAQVHVGQARLVAGYVLPQPRGRCPGPGLGFGQRYRLKQERLGVSRPVLLERDEAQAEGGLGLRRGEGPVALQRPGGLVEPAEVAEREPVEEVRGDVVGLQLDRAGEVRARGPVE